MVTHPTISLLLPSRKRPDGFRQMYDTARHTADRPDRLEFCVYLDDDDPSPYEELHDWERVTFVRGGRITLSQMWNVAFEHSSGYILHHAGDDIRFRTKGWDSRIESVISRYDDGLVLVYTRDGYGDEANGTHSFLTRRWVEVAGYFVPPYFSSDYNDTWLNEVFAEAGRRVYLDDVLIEHMHPVATYSDGRPKAEWDETHKDRLERGDRDNVVQLYADLKAKRLEDVAKIREAIR